MKNVVIFWATALILLCTNCTEEATIEGNFDYQLISADNDVYGYQRSDGAAVELAESEIPIELFGNCDQARLIDKIEILSESQLSYEAMNIWDDNGSHMEESSYEYDGSQLSFTFRDEFGNEDPVIMEHINSRLELKMNIFYLGLADGEGSVSFYYDNPNFGSSPDNALDRLGTDNESLSLMKVYYQIYGK